MYLEMADISYLLDSEIKIKIKRFLKNFETKRFLL